MISDKILPAHVLRLYTWELLKNSVGMELVDGKVPLVPLNEEPDFANAGKTYIVYGYSEQAQGGVKQVRHGSYSMRVIARTFSELGWILSTIQRAFEGQYEMPTIPKNQTTVGKWYGNNVAENVNFWSSKYENGLLVGLRFTNLEVTYVEGGDAPDTEAGPVEGLINISYDYISHQKPKKFDGTNWV